MTADRFVVEKLAGQSRYVLLDRGEDGSSSIEIGEESFVDVGGDRVLYHTLVSPEYGGQGLASVLVRAVVEDTIASGMSVVPVCPYVVAWVPKHPEYDEHIVQPLPEHIDAVRAAAD